MSSIEQHKIDEPATRRIGYLDGIRGIASVLVIFCHLACAFVPRLYFFEQADPITLKWWLKTPLNVLTNGNAAVQCFFVLSGFLITRKIFTIGQSRLTPFREYGKLLRVVIPGILFAAVLMVTGLMFHLQAADKNGVLSFVYDYNNFTPTFKSVVYDIFYRTFFDGSIYVGPFWTIRFELLGSVLVSAVAYFAYNSSHSKQIFLFIGFALLFFSPDLTSFFVGALACDCICRENEDNSVVGKVTRFLMNNGFIRFILFLLGLYLFSVSDMLSGVFKPVRYLPVDSQHPEVLRAIGIALIIVFIEKTSMLKKLLSLKLFSWMGKISAYTYAFHWPIILSVGCGLYLLLSDYLNYKLLICIISVSVFVCSFLLAYLYTLVLPKIISIEKKIAETAKNILLKRKQTN